MSRMHDSGAIVAKLKFCERSVVKSHHHISSCMVHVHEYLDMKKDGYSTTEVNVHVQCTYMYVIIHVHLHVHVVTVFFNVCMYSTFNMRCMLWTAGVSSFCKSSH